MSTTCISCGLLIPSGSGGRCATHVNPARKARSTAAWQKRSREAREAGVCGSCGGAFAASQLEAHHLVQASVNPEQTLTGPVVALCKACHRVETKKQMHTLARNRMRVVG